MGRHIASSRVPGPGPSVLLAAAILASAANAGASDTMAFFGIIEKVVFEPNAAAPERVQLWGAFAYANVSPQTAVASQVRRGYLYFRLPDWRGQVDTVRTEWRDLASLAGTGQAVGFGKWGYVGTFPTDPSKKPELWMGLVSGGATLDLRVRPASEAPANPAIYETNIGLVKLSANGSHKEIVAALKAELVRKLDAGHDQVKDLERLRQSDERTDEEMRVVHDVRLAGAVRAVPLRHPDRVVDNHRR